MCGRDNGRHYTCFCAASMALCSSSVYCNLMSFRFGLSSSSSPPNTDRAGLHMQVPASQNFDIGVGLSHLSTRSNGTIAKLSSGRSQDQSTLQLCCSYAYTIDLCSPSSGDRQRPATGKGSSLLVCTAGALCRGFLGALADKRWGSCARRERLLLLLLRQLAQALLLQRLCVQAGRRRQRLCCLGGRHHCLRKVKIVLLDR